MNSKPKKAARRDRPVSVSGDLRTKRRLKATGLNRGEADGVERDAAKVTPLDPTDLETPATALGRASLELAGQP